MRLGGKKRRDGVPPVHHRATITFVMMTAVMSGSQSYCRALCRHHLCLYLCRGILIWIRILNLTWTLTWNHAWNHHHRHHPFLGTRRPCLQICRRRHRHLFWSGLYLPPCPTLPEASGGP